MSRPIAALVLVLPLACSSGGSKPAPTASASSTIASSSATIVERRPSASASAPAPPGVFTSTHSAGVDRLTAIFGTSIATEDAKKEIGTVAPPPGSPDKTMWIATITPPKPISPKALGAAIPRGVIPPPDDAIEGRYVDDHERWGNESNEGAYDLVAVRMSLIDFHRHALTAAALDAEADRARAIASALGAPPPVFEMTNEVALKKAGEFLAFAKRSDEEKVDFEVVVDIEAPEGKSFPARLVWDATYSAGFEWGDGDYFHWLPPGGVYPDEGITVSQHGGKASYFFPEVAKDPAAVVGTLELSFDIHRVDNPTQMFDVTIRAAHYFARRLGGTVTDREHHPLDEKAARAAVEKTEKALRDHGIPPGSTLAANLFR